MEGTDTKETKIVLTKPLSLDFGDSYDEYKAPNMLLRALSLLKNIRPGSDLTRLQVSLTILCSSNLHFLIGTA